ncbi:MAG: SCO6745 family protein [Nitriliruptoraceae bacterium]
MTGQDTQHDRGSDPEHDPGSDPGSDASDPGSGTEAARAAVDPGLARQVWGRLEAIHVLAYVAPEVQAAHTALGLGDRGTGYVAGRSAPFGPVGPEVVTAAFHGFAPRLIRHALPAAWERARPEAVLEATTTAVRGVLAGLLDGAATLEQAAVLAREAADHQPILGRPLAAAWSSVPFSDDPVTVLWQAASRIRESRGDGHVALLVEAELDGVEAHLTTRGDSPKLRRILGATRAITDAEWDAAADRLRQRGLLAEDGALTVAGQQLRMRLEQRTDELTVPGWSALGRERTETLRTALDPLVARVLEPGLVPGVVARVATS